MSAISEALFWTFRRCRINHHGIVIVSQRQSCPAGIAGTRKHEGIRCRVKHSPLSEQTHRKESVIIRKSFSFLYISPALSLSFRLLSGFPGAIFNGQPLRASVIDNPSPETQVFANDEKEESEEAQKEVTSDSC